MFSGLVSVSTHRVEVFEQVDVQHVVLNVGGGARRREQRTLHGPRTATPHVLYGITCDKQRHRHKLNSVLFKLIK